MKKSLLSLLLGCLLHNASAQIGDFTWFQNQYHNRVQDFTFLGTQVWVAKPDYVMMLDTVSGQTQVFNDFVFPDYAYFGSSTIFNSILVDDNGYVFVNYYGIVNGIFVYDGQTWTNYPASGFPDQNPYGVKLMKSSQNHFFMAKGNTVGEFDGTNWQFFPYAEGVRSAVIDSHDTLWLTSPSGNLISFYEDVFTFRVSIGNDYPMVIDDFDNLFIPLSYLKILKFHSAIIIDTITVPLFYDLNFSMVTADSNSNIYFGGYNNHYYKFDGSNWSELSADIPGNINDYESAISMEDDHHVWFGSINGFLVKHENDFSSTAYIVNYSGLPDNGNYTVSAFFSSAFYNWGGFVGTSDGLFRIDWVSHLLTNIDSGFNSILTDKRINCIEKFGDYYIMSLDTAWFGTNEGLFGEDNNYNWVQFTSANSPLPNDTINYILYDFDKLWVATNGGVACYHFNGTWQTFTTANSPLPSDDVHSIGQSYPYYIFCTTNGVAYYNDPDWKILNTTNSGLIDNDIKCFYANYFGTVAHGICDSTANGGWIYLNTSTGLPSDSITFIHSEYGFGEPVIAGTKGGGYLGFNEGIYLYNTTNIEGIDFSDATDQSILFLGEGEEIWITTDKGLLYLDIFGSAPVLQTQSNGITAYVTGDDLFVQFKLQQSGAVIFDLFDMEGRSLAHVKSFGNTGDNHFQFPVANLSSGIYVLRMRTDYQNSAVKILKAQ